MQRLLMVCLLTSLHITLFANVHLPKLFGDHMVLQRGQKIFVWGWASPKEKIMIILHGQNVSVVAGKDGKWRAELAPESAGGPFQLTVKGKNTITLNDILIGDVWICSGQSNMEWPLSSTMNADKEIPQANYPMIRHIKIPSVVAAQPQQDIQNGEWKICTPTNAGEFTAVGYFFGKALFKELGVPVGLINSTWGGTHSETWTSREGFEGSDEFKEMISHMPKLDLDSLSKMKNEQTLKRMKELQGGLPASEAEAQEWKNDSFDDSAWRTMEVPALWESQELGDFDGVVWLRKSFTVQPENGGKSATINLSMIDDSDQTYVNGVKVGSMISKWNDKRSYNIPEGILKAGKNIVAVRVEDTGGGGGVHGEAKDVYVQVGEQVIPLPGKWLYKVESLMPNSSAVSPNAYPTLLFNAMINPLIPLGIKGVIWYQGESNAERSYQYRKAFPLMINDWRNHWKQGNFPFYFVQLATWNASNGNSQKGSGWAELREAQTMTLSLPNTGMAVTTDIGDPVDIHPRNKEDVGKRLAALALNRTYGKTQVDSGPMFESMEVKGDKVIVKFKNTGGGLSIHDRYGYLKGFELAGADQKFYYAKADVQGNTVSVYSKDVPNPVAVRFGWADDDSECNLFNIEGFPAVPFRSDSWKGITEGKKFSF